MIRGSDAATYVARRMGGQGVRLNDALSVPYHMDTRLSWASYYLLTIVYIISIVFRSYLAAQAAGWLDREFALSRTFRACCDRSASVWPIFPLTVGYGSVAASGTIIAPWVPDAGSWPQHVRSFPPSASPRLVPAASSDPLVLIPPSLFIRSLPPYSTPQSCSIGPRSSLTASLALHPPPGPAFRLPSAAFSLSIAPYCQAYATSSFHAPLPPFEMPRMKTLRGARRCTGSATQLGHAVGSGRSGNPHRSLRRIHSPRAHRSSEMSRDPTLMRSVVPCGPATRQDSGGGRTRLLRNAVLRAPGLSRTPTTPPTPSLPHRLRCAQGLCADRRRGGVFSCPPGRYTRRLFRAVNPARTVCGFQRVVYVFVAAQLYSRPLAITFGVACQAPFRASSMYAVWNDATTPASVRMRCVRRRPSWDSACDAFIARYTGQRIPLQQHAITT
ncbi:hypothetical protein B0H16DRAFT_1742359 [Mycena metata]|uniref:Uncharacterized protein n=1 Tax=Mycena metata TaxID=1033252 RepID=A0AAD7H9S3_9AGAR|nr:hypothetical protein B0H16DRAFT_1742359 [Mycena metata]